VIGVIGDGARALVEAESPSGFGLFEIDGANAADTRWIGRSTVPYSPFFGAVTEYQGHFWFTNWYQDTVTEVSFAPTPPSAPTGVVATGHVASTVVSWSVPGSNGGRTITGYAATAEPGGETCSPASVNVLSCTITGLVNGHSYVVGVTAMNSQGSGAESNPAPTVPGVATSTSLQLTATRTAVSSESKVLIKIRVIGPAGARPSGWATISLGPSRSIAVALRDGWWSGTVATLKVAPGTYHVLARYGGGSGYGNSASLGQSLTIVRG
jgi:hypothetical protein